MPTWSYEDYECDDYFGDDNDDDKYSDDDDDNDTKAFMHGMSTDGAKDPKTPQ